MREVHVPSCEALYSQRIPAETSKRTVREKNWTLLGYAKAVPFDVR